LLGYENATNCGHGERDGSLSWNSGRQSPEKMPADLEKKLRDLMARCAGSVK